MGLLNFFTKSNPWQFLDSLALLYKPLIIYGILLITFAFCVYKGAVDVSSNGYDEPLLSAKHFKVDHDELLQRKCHQVQDESCRSQVRQYRIVFIFLRCSVVLLTHFTNKIYLIHFIKLISMNFSYSMMQLYDKILWYKSFENQLLTEHKQDRTIFKLKLYSEK